MKENLKTAFKLIVTGLGHLSKFFFAALLGAIMAVIGIVVKTVIGYYFWD